MDDLTRWLRAQLDEDAARAAQWHDLECEIHARLDAGLVAAVAVSRMLDEVPGAVCDCDGPGRVLREIDAKRQMMRQAFEHAATIDGEWGCCHDAEAIEAGRCDEQHPDHLPLLRLLALPYADRPGYRDEWRP